ncbi:MAG: hypothetical protein OXI49_03595 [Acidobacteriota bacterium]|nr:hypothetical protein [Acidobacteriota bacterium]
MHRNRTRSDDDPFTDRESSLLGFEVLTKAEAMGIVGGSAALRLDSGVWENALERIRQAGIGKRLRWEAPEGGHDHEHFVRRLEQLSEALEESPVPATEGPKLDAMLGHELLARLLAVSVVSLRRYLSGARRMPDRVAARLHYLAFVTFHVAGGFTDEGVRLWFDRPRYQLDGATAAELLAGDWQPDEPGPRRVRELARWLDSSPAT